MPTPAELAQDCVIEMLDAPMDTWEIIRSTADPEMLAIAVKELDFRIELMIRLRGYLDRQIGNTDHFLGVKEANDLAYKLRKILGYTYPRVDVNF